MVPGPAPPAGMAMIARPWRARQARKRRRERSRRLRTVGGNQAAVAAWISIESALCPAASAAENHAGRLPRPAQVLMPSGDLYFGAAVTRAYFSPRLARGLGAPDSLMSAAVNSN